MHNYNLHTCCCLAIPKFRPKSTLKSLIYFQYFFESFFSRKTSSTSFGPSPVEPGLISWVHAYFDEPTLSVIDGRQIHNENRTVYVCATLPIQRRKFNISSPVTLPFHSPPPTQRHMQSTGLAAKSIEINDRTRTYS